MCTWDTWNLIQGLDFIWRNDVWIKQITSTANENNFILYFNHKLILRYLIFKIVIILTIYVAHKLHMSKIYELPEDGQQLRPKHARAFINK
jgi:hypothetical protein